MRLDLLVPALALFGCGGGSTKIPDGGTVVEADADADVDADTDTDTDSDADADDPPCFEDDVVPMLERSCGSGDNSCHAAIAYGADPSNSCLPRSGP